MALRKQPKPLPYYNETKERPPRQVFQPIDNVEFVKAWMTMDVPHLAKKFNRSKASIYAKANSLRKKGVKLPVKQKTYERDDVNNLNRLIERYSKR
jgi:hypothetical protein